jgi:hypothetical protein
MQRTPEQRRRQRRKQWYLNVVPFQRVSGGDLVCTSLIACVRPDTTQEDMELKASEAAERALLRTSQLAASAAQMARYTGFSSSVPRLDEVVVKTLGNACGQDDQKAFIDNQMRTFRSLVLVFPLCEC